MGLAIATVCSSIAGLSVAGVTIKNANQIPPDVTRLIPCLFPRPNEFVTDFTMTRESYGGGSSAKMDLEYNLHYTFCFAPIGSGRTGLDIYDEMMAKAAAILDAVVAIDTLAGLVDITPEPVTSFGSVVDPAGVLYSGCEFTFHILEFGPNG